VLIVGEGASGVLMAAHLLRRGDQSCRVTLLERRRLLGCGVAYSTDDPDRLLNTRVENMSAFADDPEHFRTWLGARGLQGDHGGFVRRSVYGAYMACLLDPWRGDSRLACIRDECTDLAETASGVAARLSDGAALAADLAILATGPPLPKPSGDGVIASPWTANPGSDIDEPVLILGSGLTMVDQVLTLLRRGHRAEIFALSRRGLLPRWHLPTRPLAIDAAEVPAHLPISQLLRWLRRRVAEAEVAGGNWRDVMDGLRPHVQGIWMGMPPTERRRFLRHAATWWDVHRHRMPPETHARIADALARGQLRILRGTLASASRAGAGRLAEIDLWPKRGRKTMRVGQIIDCRGTRREPSDDDAPPIGALLAVGKARIDPLRLGIEVDEACRVIDAEGRATPRLLAIGPVSRAAFWEITAIPDIRLQVASVAARLTRSPPDQLG
jgi:uncharacterized NAD(P)/FAD-binding protein YdhS